MTERYSLRVVTPPPYGAISRESAKSYLNVDLDDQNDEIDAMILAAGEWFEGYTAMTLIQTTYEMALDTYPCGGVFELPRSPVLWVDSVSYIDSEGALQTWDAANYQTDLVGVPPRITVAYAGSTPTSYRADMNSWRVRFTAGHASEGSPTDGDGYRANIPALATLAIKTYVLGAFEGNLEAAITAAESLARSLRRGFI